MLIHADLVVTQMSRSLEFYREVLGLSVADDAVVEGELAMFLSGGTSRGGRLVLLRAAPIGSMVELIEYLPRLAVAELLRPAPHRGSLTLLVPDLDQSVVRIQEAGVAVDGGPFTAQMPVFGRSRVAFVRDPDGHSIELLQRLPATT